MRKIANFQCGMLAAVLLTVSHMGAQTLVLTSTNNASGNHVIVFRLETSGTGSLNEVSSFSTGGNGGASANAGAVQFDRNFGAVVNYGSNNVTRLVRFGNSIAPAGMISLASGCEKPASVALSGQRLFVVGADCAESHVLFSGALEGSVVSLSNTSAAQIAVGESWAAVTMTAGSVLQLPLNGAGFLSGTSSAVTLPADANNTPLGEAFWGDLLAFNPAHSPDSFALVNRSGGVFPVLGPQPAYPTNAPCWLAKGPGSVWYAGNSPADAISIFFSDGQGGVFYKSVPLAGSPTDLSVSPDQKWLAVIFTAKDGSGGRVEVFAIDGYGDLSAVATSEPVGAAAFSGVAFSE